MSYQLLSTKLKWFPVQIHRRVWNWRHVAHTSQISDGSFEVSGSISYATKWASNLPYPEIILINLLQGSLLASEEHGDLMWLCILNKISWVSTWCDTLIWNESGPLARNPRFLSLTALSENSTFIWWGFSNPWPPRWGVVEGIITSCEFCPLFLLLGGFSWVPASLEPDFSFRYLRLSTLKSFGRRQLDF